MTNAFIERHKHCSVYPMQSDARGTGWRYRVWKHAESCVLKDEVYSEVYPRGPVAEEAAREIAIVALDTAELALKGTVAEIERLRGIIMTGGAMYRAERAALGVPDVVDGLSYRDGWHAACDELLRGAEEHKEQIVSVVVIENTKRMK